MPQSRTLPSYLGPHIPPVSAFSLADILDHLQQECGDASDAMLNVVETFQGDLGMELRRKLDAESKLQLVNSQQARRAHTLSKRASVARSKLDRYSAKHSSIDDEIDRMIETAASASSLAKLVASKLCRVQQLITHDLMPPSKYTVLNTVFPGSETLIAPEINRADTTTGYDGDLPLPQIISVDDQTILEVNREASIVPHSHNGHEPLRKSGFEIVATPGGILTSNSQPTVPLSSETHHHAIAELLSTSNTIGEVSSNREQRTSTSLLASPIHLDAPTDSNIIPYNGEIDYQAYASAASYGPSNGHTDTKELGVSTGPSNGHTDTKELGVSTGSSNGHTHTEKVGASTGPSNGHTHTEELDSSTGPSNGNPHTEELGNSSILPAHGNTVNILPTHDEMADDPSKGIGAVNLPNASEAMEEPMTPEAFEDFMASSISKFRDLQKKRYKEAPFFLEPPPTIPHQNPLNLLYSSLLAKQSLVTFLHQSGRPLFSILRAKSDPTIMQTLQTSHFKKLRISGTHIGPEHRCVPCQGPVPVEHGLDPDTICEDETEDSSLPTATITSLVPEILGIDQVDDYDDSSDEEISKPSPRSPSRTHKPSHRTLRPKRSILKLRDKPKQRVPRFAPESPLKISSPKSSNVYSPAQPLVVCAHGANATLVRPPALDLNEPGPFPFSDAASIESHRSIKSLQKLQEYI